MNLLKFFALVPVIFCQLFAHNLHARECISNQTSFTADYVVIGVGTAGGLLANRLSRDKKTSVIALHIGENLTQDPLIKFSKNAVFTVPAPLLGTPLPFDPASLNLPIPLRSAFQTYLGALSPTLPPLYDTGVTIPQPDADFRQLLWAMALPLGGASSINAGAWCTGTDELYAQWEAIAGPEWSVKRIRGIYKKLEDYDGKTNNPEFRGFHGPIDVRQVPASAISRKFTDAMEKGTNTSFVLDYNDPLFPIGVSSQIQLTQRGCDNRGSLRVSSSTAFLGPKVMKPDGTGVHGRKLQVLFNSFAQKVIWDGTRAAGVQFVQDGVTKTVFANKGVIVSAGVRSSTFLLESGVGPQSLLNALNIPVIFDNPNVGQNLSDQPHIIFVYTTNPADRPSRNSLITNIAWLPAPGGNPKSRQVRFSTFTTIPGVALLLVDLVQPLSRGSITINSADPAAPFVMDLGELTNPYDFTLFFNALSQYLPAVNAQLQQIDPLYQMVYPDPAVLTDPILLSAFIRENVGPNQHYQSHCRMAPLNQGGVVDSTGHVYGVQNLIVADDSVSPLVMDGSPMASAYLIAANIARLLGY